MDIRAKRDSVTPVAIGDLVVGATDRPLTVIAGLCVIESPAHTLEIARRLRDVASRVGVPLVFKASFDKANRSSVSSYRGPGMKEGLEVLATVRRETGLPILTDVHEPRQCEAVGAVVDVLQVPAFLARQTDLLQAAAATGKVVNVKKSQHMAPEDMGNVVDKLMTFGCAGIILTERGTSFGYKRLLNDFSGLQVMRGLGWPVCFDATHSVQLPGGMGTSSGGRREAIPLLARAAAAVGIDALFLETHDHPELALSDGPNALPLDQVEPLLRQVLALDELVTGRSPETDLAVNFETSPTQA